MSKYSFEKIFVVSTAHITEFDNRELQRIADTDKYLDNLKALDC